MPRLVEVPGYDQPVEFPDGMSDDQIAGVLRKQGGVRSAQSASASTPSPTPTPEPKQPSPDWIINPITGTVIGPRAQDPIADAEIGAGKGAASTAASTGELATRTGHAISDRDLGAFTGDHPYTQPFSQFKREFTTPANPAQSTGKSLEQLGEFFAIPEADAAKLGLGMRMLRGAATNAAGQAVQGGQVNKGTAVAGVLGGSMPPILDKAAGMAAGLKESARQGLARLFRVTSREKGFDAALGQIEQSPEVMGAIDQMLADGGLVNSSMTKLSNSRQALADQAAQDLEKFRVGDDQHLVDVVPTLRDLFKARQGFITPGTVNHTAKPAALAALEDRIQNLQDLAQQFNGRMVPRDSLESVRHAMDDVYAGNVLPKEASAAGADKAYADTIRQTLNAEDPARAALTQPLTRRIAAADLTAAAARKAYLGPQPPKLLKSLGQVAAGAAGGAYIGGKLGHADIGALSGGAAASSALIEQFLRSPLYQTASASTKNAIGNLLERGDIATLSNIAMRALIGASAQATRPDFPEPLAPQDQP